MSDKRLTWRQLKEAANELPEELLDDKVFGWAVDDEAGVKMVEILTLEEDHVFNGDDACAPRSELKEMTEPEDWDDDEYYVVHKKGTKILVYT